MTRAFKSALFGAATLALSAGVLTTTTTPAAACPDSPYLGSVCWIVTKWCPDGYTVADGRLLQLGQNQALFSLVGTTYGGDGRTTFALPDLRGRTVLASGQGKGLSTNIPLGAYGGAENTVLTAAQMAPHTHPATFNPTGGGSGGSQQVVVPATPSTLDVQAALPLGTTVAGSATPAAGNNYLNAASASVAITTLNIKPVDFKGPFTTTAPSTNAQLLATTKITGSPGNPEIKFSVPTGGITGGTVTVQPNTGGAPVPIRDPYLGLTGCIATTGLYPVNPN